MKLTPVNIAEAVIEAFWDPQLSGFSQWEVKNGSEHGLLIRQQWCYVEFEWAKKPADGICINMKKRFDTVCQGYDKLIISLMAPPESILEVDIETDRGVINYQSPPAPPIKKEYTIALDGAEKILSMNMKIHAYSDGISTGWFNFIGLVNAELLDRYLKQWDRFDSEWESYLKPDSYQPSFQIEDSLIMNNDELKEFRSKHAEILRKTGNTPFTEKAEIARKLVPEKMIHGFVNFNADTRYNRERDHGKDMLSHGLDAAIAGLLLQDKRLLRLAARYAMSIAMCGHWDDGMICKLPGSTFEHRSFVQSLCVFESALILDLAGEMFTDLARDYILRRTAKEGLASINFSVWKYEYIFYCNQLAWFTPGRMAGYLLLEKHMDRVSDYTDLAYKDLVENLNHTILPDGGYVEGPTYFKCVGRDAGLSLYMYARARKLNFADIAPERMKKTSSFAEAILSTDDDQDAIPICDGRPISDEESMAIMASLLPDSQWVGMYRKAIKRNKGIPSTWLSAILDASIPAEAPELCPFIFLPDMGVMSSVRKMDGEIVKLFIMGNNAGAGHSHEDKGSFVLEFAGETFAMDPGVCDYASPIAMLMKKCERHNMLIPDGTNERPHPLSPLPMHVKPHGSGDETSFAAVIDATPGWERFYQKWIRSWSSPSPRVLHIKDEYELVDGKGVKFLLNTMLSPVVKGEKVTLQGKRGKVDIIPPADCIVDIEELDLIEGKKQHRISIGKEDTAGCLEVRIELSVH